MFSIEFCPKINSLFNLFFLSTAIITVLKFSFSKNSLMKVSSGLILISLRKIKKKKKESTLLIFITIFYSIPFKIISILISYSITILDPHSANLMISSSLRVVLVMVFNLCSELFKIWSKWKILVYYDKNLFICVRIKYLKYLNLSYFEYGYKNARE